MGMLLYMMELSQKNNANTGVAEKAAPEVSTETEKKGFSYTAEEIKAMKGDKLRKFAKDNGIDNPEDYTAGELKSILSDKIS